MRFTKNHRVFSHNLIGAAAVLAITLCVTPQESAAQDFNLGNVNRSIEILNEKIEQNTYYTSPHLGSPLYRLKNESGGYLTAGTNGALTLVEKKILTRLTRFPMLTPAL
jgi:hypothetical protein